MIWAKTSYNLNSTDILSPFLLILPDTRCWDLITFQSSNLGPWAKDFGLCIKAFWSIGKKSPERSKLSDITTDIFLPILFSNWFEEKKLVIAIGVGFIVPWVIVKSKAIIFVLKN